MIHVGNKYPLKVCCLNCGQPTNDHYEASDFFVMQCANLECAVSHTPVLVERRTGLLLSCDARTAYIDGEWKRIYPAMYDKDGKQVWPQSKVVLDSDPNLR